MAQDDMLIYTIKLRMHVASINLYLLFNGLRKSAFQITCDLFVFDFYNNKVYYIGSKRAKHND